MLITDYRNLPGEHCGSTAMRNLLYHYCGLELSEEAVFGLGAGLDFLYLASERYRPSSLIFGRSVSLEQDLATSLGVDYREQIELDNDAAWHAVRAEVDAGRPTMLSGDALYLDYRDFKVHFPAHRYVLLGYDDAEEVAFVADRLDPEPQRCSYDALRLSRNPPEFISTYNLWGKFFGTRVSRSIEDAYRHALATNARRMLTEDPAAVETLRATSDDPTVKIAMGLPGMAGFLDDLPAWRESEDRRFLAKYAADCIEKFGTGGGNFRKMYAEFLREARQLVPERVPEDAPERAARSAALWTKLAGHLAELAKSGGGSASVAAVEAMSRILDEETRLFESLAVRSGDP
jgi:hypothetical protein